MTPEWAVKYVGLEFQHHGRGPAFDCWGLVRHILREEYQIDAPDYRDQYLDGNDRTGVPNAFAIGCNSGWVRVEEPSVGDVIILLVARRPMHCGIVVGPRCMLHARPQTGSCIESYDRPQWNRRIEGFYRHGSRLGG